MAIRLGAGAGGLAVAAIILAACGGDGDATPTTTDAAPRRGDGGDYQAALDPADFVARIDNPLLPFLPGSRWLYESSDGVERIEVEVLSETRDVLGIQATSCATASGRTASSSRTPTLVRTGSRRQRLVPGEDSTEFEDGEPVSTAGSWEAGVDGTQAGVIMWADPTVGQGLRPGVLRRSGEGPGPGARPGRQRDAAVWAYNDLVVIREWSPLEPEVIENKYFAPGVGVVLELKVAGEEGASNS